VELRDGRTADLTCRMYHLAHRPMVEPGDEIDQEYLIGSYGATGDPRNVTGPHLHIEFDLDTRWPCLAPGVRIGGGKIINTAEEVEAAGGIVDTTINPALVFWPAEGQTLTGNDEWLKAGWFTQEELEFTVHRLGDKVAPQPAKLASMETEADYLALKARYDNLVAHLRAVFETVQKE